MHGQIDLAPARQILDVAVAAVLGTAWNRPGAFLADALLGRVVGRSCMHVLRLRWLSDDAGEGGCLDQLGFPPVPLGEDLMRRGTAEDSWVDEAGEADAWDVARGAKDAFEVPDGFGPVLCQCLGSVSRAGVL
jgi:hypothetical protein